MNFEPEDNRQYKTKEYWNQRFEKEENFEWLVTFKDVKDQIDELVPKESNTLIVGCGNSSFSRDLYEHGHEKLTNIDYSEAVIERMSEKNRDCANMKWLEMDMRYLDFPESSFDVVIDKAGTDALCADEGPDPWNPNEKTRNDMHEVCESVLRVLKPGGLFMMISFGQPHFRKIFLDKEEFAWDLEVRSVPVGLGYFMYLLRKHK
eukprot:TRINITY_DN10557_c0_g1_i1.p1 TRINITY_DN10557_c0_g1~~TRINITY_DN10557_c0_g1_i1.p1  ORF type:complete len:213 (+),score=44.56 TRINITY_DN10557_c0_g1_i1:25-639(+)